MNSKWTFMKCKKKKKSKPQRTDQASLSSSRSHRAGFEGEGPKHLWLLGNVPGVWGNPWWCQGSQGCQAGPGEGPCQGRVAPDGFGSLHPSQPRLPPPLCSGQRWSWTFVLKNLLKKNKPQTNEEKEKKKKKIFQNWFLDEWGTNVNLSLGSHIKTSWIPRHLCYGPLGLLKRYINI